MRKGFAWQCLLTIVLFAFIFDPAAAEPPGNMLVLDCSQSMQRTLDTRPGMENARPAALRFVKSLPQNSLAGIVAYGQNAAKGCDNAEVLVPLAPYDRRALISAIKKVQPQGKAPLAAALRKAWEQGAGLSQGCVITLITDGWDDCWGDPVSMVEDLKARGAGIIVNIIGVAPNREDAAKLMRLARASGGAYRAADTRADLILKAAETAESVSAANPFVQVDQPGRKPRKPQEQFGHGSRRPLAATDEVQGQSGKPGDFRAQFIPLPGWNGGKVSIQDYTKSGASMLIAEQTLQKNHARIRTAVKAGSSGIASNPYSVEGMPDLTDPGVTKTTSTINGFSVQNVYDKRRNKGCLVILLHKDNKSRRHALLALVYNNISADRAMELSRFYDWRALKEITRDYKAILREAEGRGNANAYPGPGFKGDGKIFITALKRGKPVPARVRFFKRGTMEVAFTKEIPGRQRVELKIPYGRYDVGVKPEGERETIEANVDVLRGESPEVVMRF
ncbi:von Willebrand factor type A [Desulfatibacillum aliphaticivorans]|uniref:von Willebrand factor type A n=1 Tax=Desulfatibacillum aliphaticivorans TaxID=218208 RepID=B8FAA9_DESAL|nr:vWA domain-containing protein [Desulfatibacillum aliphaticivorans]ACL03205.1 von Willebrand factor type A [Desulfatibacillum aliphaticivorans]